MKSCTQEAFLLFIFIIYPHSTLAIIFYLCIINTSRLASLFSKMENQLFMGGGGFPPPRNHTRANAYAKALFSFTQIVKKGKKG